MKSAISVPAIRNLQPESRPYELVDERLTGFLARVQPTGSITYYFSYRAQDGARRRYRIGSHPGTTAIAARKAAENLAAQVVQGKDPHLEKKQLRITRQRTKHETLEGFIDQKYAGWANSHQKRSSETIALLKRNFGHLYGRRLSEISSWDIQKWRSERAKAGYKPSAINRSVTTLKALLNKAVEWEVINTNPLQSIKPLKLDKSGRIRYLSDVEEARLRDALEKRESELRQGRESGNRWRRIREYDELPVIEGEFADYLQPLVLLTLNTGLRRGEIFSLTWANIDFGNKSLTVVGAGAKSGHTRHVPLNKEAIFLLSKWRKQSKGELVFTNPHTDAKFDNIYTSWTNLLRAAEIQDFRFHDLRHTFASNLVMAGVDLYTVKELMGHSTVQMTESYAHLAPEHKANAVERLVTRKIESTHRFGNHGKVSNSKV